MTGSIIVPLESCERSARHPLGGGRHGAGSDGLDVVVWEADGRIGPATGYGGPIAQRLAAAGFVVAVVPLVERAPTAAELRAPAHVVSGGNTSVHDQVDWLLRASGHLSDVVDRALAGEASLTGICFGAQLIARLMFGADAVGPHRSGLQAGLVDVCDQVSGNTYTACSFHFHHVDRGSVERAGADVVCSSDATPVEVFEFASVRGVQFHPEWEPGDLAGALRSNRDVVDLHRLSLADIDSSIRERAADWDDHLWNRFVVDPVRSVTADRRDRMISPRRWADPSPVIGRSLFDEAVVEDDHE